MHNRSNPNDVVFEARLGSQYVGAHYTNLLEDVKRELSESIDLARRAGVAEQRIIVDPGIGFGKTIAHNLELLDRTDALKSLDRRNRCNSSDRHRARRGHCPRARRGCDGARGAHDGCDCAASISGVERVGGG
jgi:dihydropteroate synthase